MLVGGGVSAPKAALDTATVCATSLWPGWQSQGAESWSDVEIPTMCPGPLSGLCFVCGCVGGEAAFWLGGTRPLRVGVSGSGFSICDGRLSLKLVPAFCS